MMEYFLLSFAVMCKGLITNDSRRYYGFHGANSHFERQALDFEAKSCRSFYFRSLTRYFLVFDGRRRVDCFFFALPSIHDQFQKAQFLY